MSVFYDREKALDYARRWAFDRNPRWYNFDALGGDCTNFVSQCVYAGRNEMNFAPTFGWYYRSLQDRAPAWTGVEPFGAFLVSNRGAGPHAAETERGGVTVGDVVQLGNGDRFYHTLFVCGDRDGIFVAAHTGDAFMRPLDSYSYDRVRFLHIADGDG